MIAELRLKARIVPRPVFCVIEPVYRRQAVAEEVCAGRFTHIGITRVCGTAPNWLAADLPADEEWRIEWSKFYYGLDLAQAYAESGDAKFLRAWERLVGSWMAQVPVGFDASDVTGRRLLNWIYAWSQFASSPKFAGLTDKLEEKIITSISRQVQHLRHHLTAERNHRTLELYALFIVALALPEIDRHGKLRDFATGELGRNLMADVREDGVHRESSTHYHMTALRSFLGMRENARRFGLALPKAFDERLVRACEFAMHCHRPDGLIPALSDSDTGSYADLLKLAALIYGRADFLYVATAGQAGVRPQERCKSFALGGYFTERSGWGEGEQKFSDERYLIFDCGPLGDGGHGHYDLLNVEIAAEGRPLVIDPGRYTYSEETPNWRRWFKSTAAHNTVCIDGLDQTPYHRGKPKGLLAQGQLIERCSAPQFDMLCGAAISPVYDARHTRRIFFVAGQYWIIVDRLQGEQPHRFDLRFHLTPEAQEQVALGSQGSHLVARTPDLALVFCGPAKLKIEPGWYAPLYGTKLPAPVISASITGVTAADFFTLVTPLKSNQPMPVFQVHQNPPDLKQPIVFEVSHPTLDGPTTDIVSWSDSGDPLSLASFACRATAAWLRKSYKQSRLTACNVQELSRAPVLDAPLFESAHPARWLTWDERVGIQLDDGRML